MDEAVAVVAEPVGDRVWAGDRGAVLVVAGVVDAQSQRTYLTRGP